MFCTDLIKQSAPDILPNLLKDCKTIDDIREKLPKVEYKYDITRKEQITFNLGGVEFSVPLNKKILDDAINGIKKIENKDKQNIKKGIIKNDESDTVALDAINETINANKIDDTFNEPKNFNKQVTNKIILQDQMKNLPLFDESSFEGIRIGNISSGMSH